MSTARDFVSRHRRAIAAAVIAAAAVGFVVFVVPQIKGMGPTLHRLRHADPRWSIAAVLLEAASLGGYIVLFKTVFSCHDAEIGWRESYQINMAGTVASKLFAAAGAGGVALTVWALNASGLKPAAITRRMLTFEVLLYAVFAGALVVCGVGLRSGVLAGDAPWTLTVVPAAVGGLVIVVAAGFRLMPERLVARLRHAHASAGWARRLLSFAAAAPSALRNAMSVSAQLIRDRRPGVLGAVAYWGFDIATLWAALHAFGTPPPFATVVMSYFIGQLGNALPLPGGVGGVEGGTIGALVAFGTPASLALLGVLGYRFISFWLPTVPGAIAYLRLRRTVGRWQVARREEAAVRPQPSA